MQTRLLFEGTNLEWCVFQEVHEVEPLEKLHQIWHTVWPSDTQLTELLLIERNRGHKCVKVVKNL